METQKVKINIKKNKKVLFVKKPKNEENLKHLNLLGNILTKKFCCSIFRKIDIKRRGHIITENFV